MDLQKRMSATNRSDSFLEGIYREHQASLCAYVRRRFGPGPPEPEDIAQEAFARFADREDLRAIPNPKAFLMLTARNLAIDAHRKIVRGNMAMRSATILAENSHDCDASDVLSSKEELARLAAVVDGLKPKQRAAFLLHRVDGLSYVAIGERLGLSPSGARALVETALALCVARMRKL